MVAKEKESIKLVLYATFRVVEGEHIFEMESISRDANSLFKEANKLCEVQ